MVKIKELVYIIKYLDENGKWRTYPRPIKNSEDFDEIIRRRIEDWKEIRILERWLITVKDCDGRVVRMYLSDE